MRRPRLRLVPDWRRAWRFLSVQLAAVLGGLGAIQSGLPDVEPIFPPHIFAKITLSLSVLIIVLRVIKQFRDEESS